MHFGELHLSDAVFGELIFLVQGPDPTDPAASSKSFVRLAGIFLNVTNLLFSQLQSRKNVCLLMKKVKVKHLCLYTYIVLSQRN